MRIECSIYFLSMRLKAEYAKLRAYIKIPDFVIEHYNVGVKSFMLLLSLLVSANLVLSIKNNLLGISKFYPIVNF